MSAHKNLRLSRRKEKMEMGKFLESPVRHNCCGARKDLPFYSYLRKSTANSHVSIQTRAPAGLFKKMVGPTTRSRVNWKFSTWSPLRNTARDEPHTNKSHRAIWSKNGRENYYLARLSFRCLTCCLPQKKLSITTFSCHKIVTTGQNKIVESLASF